jgi:hypothetical protein
VTLSINDTQHNNVLPLCLVPYFIYFVLNFILLNVIMLSVIMLNVALLSARGLYHNRQMFASEEAFRCSTLG